MLDKGDTTGRFLCTRKLKVKEKADIDVILVDKG